MATATISTSTSSTSSLAKIGDTAGLIWHTLDESGPRAITQLVKQIDAPRDVVMQAIGWLAREDKIEIEETGRSKIVSLVY